MRTFHMAPKHLEPVVYEIQTFPDGSQRFSPAEAHRRVGDPWARDWCAICPRCQELAAAEESYVEELRSGPEAIEARSFRVLKEGQETNGLGASL